jgi:hypothetical protein
MKFFTLFLLSFFAFFTIFAFSENNKAKETTGTWELQSIDTMKYSRDLARETLKNDYHKALIKSQVAEIADTGATHVAIGTPYDEEFLPVLRLWVSSAREHEMSVFFRGNFSGWEEWFGYKKINRREHLENTRKFIEGNPELFEDGDIFSSCPECENGEKLDRSSKQQLASYSAFLVEEYNITKNSFEKINKKVASNYFSMNGDIALAIMNKEMTRALDGIVVIDHYVKTPEKLDRDISIMAEKSGGKIVLGEFGAPIPDIHGKMTEEQQKIWIEEALVRLEKNPHVIGVNYWVNRGGSTALWRDNGNPKQVVGVITAFFKKSSPK